MATDKFYFLFDLAYRCARPLALVLGLAVQIHTAAAAEVLQQAYLKGSNTGMFDYFGQSVAVDGDTLVIGAPLEASNATGVDGNPFDDSASGSGAAYVFVRDGSNWVQQAYLKASNTGTNDQFGFSVAVSGDTVVVGAPNESSSSRGVNGNQNNNNAVESGAVYVFVRDGTNWSQQSYLKASSTGPYFFGSFNENNGVAASGNLVAVGAPVESDYAGAAYVFTGAGLPPPPELRLSAARGGDVLQLTAAGTTNTQWRLESRDTVTGTNAWQPLTNITLGVSALVLEQPLTSGRLYRGVLMP